MAQSNIDTKKNANTPSEVGITPKKCYEIETNPLNPGYNVKSILSQCRDRQSNRYGV